MVNCQWVFLSTSKTYIIKSSAKIVPFLSGKTPPVFLFFSAVSVLYCNAFFWTLSSSFTFSFAFLFVQYYAIFNCPLSFGSIGSLSVFFYPIGTTLDNKISMLPIPFCNFCTFFFGIFILPFSHILNTACTASGSESISAILMRVKFRNWQNGFTFVAKFKTIYEKTVLFFSFQHHGAIRPPLFLVFITARLAYIIISIFLKFAFIELLYRFYNFTPLAKFNVHLWVYQIKSTLDNSFPPVATQTGECQECRLNNSTFGYFWKYPVCVATIL